MKKHVRLLIHHDAYSLVGPHLPTVNAQHKRENYPLSKHGYYVYYQWFIEENGETIHTRPDLDPSVEYKTAHRDGIPICFAGNFNHRLPTVAQEQALMTLMDRLAEQYEFTVWDIVPHSSYQATSCPGELLSDQWARKLFLQTRLNSLKTQLQWLLVHIKALYS